MPTAPTPITAPPTVPDRANAVAFPAQMFAAFQYLFGAFYSGISALGDATYDNAVDADAAAAVVSAVANVTKWISGTTYTEGAVVWSPANLQTYRRKTTGGGTTDPASDSTNWVVISAFMFKPQLINTNTSAVPFVDYVMTSACTLTLPAAPQPGDWVGIKDKTGGTSSTVVLNGNRLEGVDYGADPLNLDMRYFAAKLVYIDATRGWVFI